MPGHDNKTFGASGTSLSNLPSAALTALGGRANIDAATQIARSLVPQREPVDPALLSLLFFSNLAAESSKPGATALGAAGTAIQSPAQYLLQQREAQREAEAKLPSTALSIANMLKPPTGTGKGENFKKLDPALDKDGNLQYSAEGAPLYNYNVEDNAGNLLRKVILPDLTSAGAIKGFEFFNESGAGRTFMPGSADFMGARDGTASHGYVYSSPPSSTKTADKTRMSVVDRTIPDNPDTPINESIVNILRSDFDSSKHSPKEALPKEKTSARKVTGAGDLAKYMTKENAESYIESLGLSREDAQFDRVVERLTAKTPSQVGQPVVDAGVFLEVFEVVQDGEVVGVKISPSKTAATPYFTTYVNKRMPVLAKSQDSYMSKQTSMIPRIDQALNLLLSGTVQTGNVAQGLQPIRQAFVQLFGTTDPQVIGMENLQAIAMFLAPNMRPPGSGSTSDMEFRAFQQAALYLGNTAEANYISLYALKKVTENAIKLNQLERQLLTSGNYTNMEQITEKLNEVDTGIFKRYTGDPNDDEAIADFYNNLEEGDVAINNGIFDSPSPYVIKGFRRARN